MDKITDFCTLYNKLTNTMPAIELIRQFDKLNLEISHLNYTLEKIQEELKNKSNQYDQLLQKYNTEIEHKNKEIENKNLEMKNYSKVSFIVSMNKELDEKKNYIRILESQLEHYKSSVTDANQNKSKSKETIEVHVLDTIQSNNITDQPSDDTNSKKSKKKTNKVEENMEEPEEVSDKKLKKKKPLVEEPPQPIVEVSEKKSKKKKELVDLQVEEFDVNNFEDINGYELMAYKKKYYLRDLETNEVYDIENGKPNNIIGIITNGKIRFN